MTPGTASTPPRIALVGARGHGLRHRRVIHRLQQAGRAELVAVCSRRPVDPVDDAPLNDVRIFTDHRRMLAEVTPDVLVVSTPPHTHLPIATDGAAAGCDLLLEKPPVVTLDEYARLVAAVERSGVSCQVGFQALASPALAELGCAVRAGLLGEVRTVTVAGAWWRPDAYYRRSDWAGRHSLDGRPVADGVLANQFSHGIMQALALADLLAEGDRPVRVELERYRTRAIEVEDLACLRLTLRSDLRIVVAVTVAAAAADTLHGEVTVHGSHDSARLEYPTDRLLLPGDSDWRHVPGRTDLLANLLDHRRDAGVPLYAPLSSSREIVALLEAVHHAPPPIPVPPGLLTAAAEGDGAVLPAVADLVRTATARAALFSELAVPWSGPPHVVTLGD